MNKHQHTLRLSLYAAFILAAMVIIVDFGLPGKIITVEIINLKKERQQYFNAARNFHYSYKVITTEHQFAVAEDFAKTVRVREKIEYSVSSLFKEINWYRLFTAENRAYHSLRIISGLVLPLLIIVSIFVAYLYKKNIGTFVFVLQTLIIADLIYLLI